MVHKWFIKDIINAESTTIFKELDIGAAKVPPASEGLVILSYFLGEKTPIFDPTARGVMFGLTLSHSKEHIFRAILEAVIYGFRHHIAVIKGMGYKPKQIIATNGGAKSKFWCQIASDVLGVIVRSYPSHPGSAMGVMQDREVVWEGKLRDMTPEEVSAEYIANTPLGRMCKPEDVADVVGFLVSPEAGFMTGEAMNIAGGANIV